MKIFDIVQLNFKQLIRDKKNLFFLLLFPAVFMLIFSIGFGDNVESDIDIAIVNHDDGDVSNQLVRMKNYLQFIRLMMKLKPRKC